MNRIYRSWELFKSSLVVMMQNKTLLAFPILITLITGFMVVLFVTPVAFRPTGHSYASADHWNAVMKPFFNYEDHADNSKNPPGVTHSYSPSVRVGGSLQVVGLVYFAVMYFASMFMATFLNVAFYHEIMNALNGRPVSIAEGLRFAVSRWKIIVMWTLFAGIVGFIIKTLEQRFGIIGQIIMKILGAVWSVACVFVIPVIVTEEDTANPFAVLKKSAQTLTQTWGESLIGYAGVGFISSDVDDAAFAGVAGRGYCAGSRGAFTAARRGGDLELAGDRLFVELSAGRGEPDFPLRALYLYASQGALPQPYTEDMMRAWRGGCGRVERRRSGNIVARRGRRK